MSIQDWNLKTTFDAAYGFNAEHDGHPNTREGVRLRRKDVTDSWRDVEVCD